MGTIDRHCWSSLQPARKPDLGDPLFVDGCAPTDRVVSVRRHNDRHFGGGDGVVPHGPDLYRRVLELFIHRHIPSLVGGDVLDNVLMSPPIIFYRLASLEAVMDISFHLCAFRGLALRGAVWTAEAGLSTANRQSRRCLASYREVPWLGVVDSNLDHA